MQFDKNLDNQLSQITEFKLTEHTAISIVGAIPVANGFKILHDTAQTKLSYQRWIHTL